ncbi:hypothetical protein SH2C18_24600 [Clostridium sediminicola]
MTLKQKKVKYEKLMKIFPKKFWREIMAAFLDDDETSMELRIRGIKDMKFIEEIKKVLRHSKSTNKLPNDFDEEIASDIIYSMLMKEIMMFLYDDNVEMDDVIICLIHFRQRKYLMATL